MCVISNIIVSTAEKNLDADITALQFGLAVHSGYPEVLFRTVVHPSVVRTIYRYIVLRCFGHCMILHITCFRVDMFDSNLSAINISVHRNETCAIVCIAELHSTVNSFFREIQGYFMQNLLHLWFIYARQQTSLLVAGMNAAEWLYTLHSTRRTYSLAYISPCDESP